MGVSATTSYSKFLGKRWSFELLLCLFLSLKMASSRERTFTASQVWRLLDEDSDVSSDIEIEVKTWNICVGCHDVYLQSMTCHAGFAIRLRHSPWANFEVDWRNPKIRFRQSGERVYRQKYGYTKVRINLYCVCVSGTFIRV